MGNNSLNCFQNLAIDIVTNQCKGRFQAKNSITGENLTCPLVR